MDERPVEVMMPHDGDTRCCCGTRGIARTRDITQMCVTSRTAAILDVIIFASVGLREAVAATAEVD